MTYLQNQTEPLEMASTSLDRWMRLGRFLALGSEDGTYYVPARRLKVEDVPATIECLKSDGVRVVRSVAEISLSGRVPTNDPALFALALAASPNFANAETMAAALNALPQVARTGVHLCTFAAFAENLRGWGRGLRSAVAEWYLNQPASELAYRMLQSMEHNGWSHRDLLRLSHPKAATAVHNALFQWAVDGELGHLATPAILSSDLRQIRGYELAKKSASEGEIVQLIEENRLAQEMIPSQWLESALVWEALLPSLTYGALVRQLGKLTEVGLLLPQSPATALVVARLIDRKRIANSRIHPIALLDALDAYREEPAAVSSVVDALEEAFYMSIDNVEPIRQRIYLALHTSTAASATLAMSFVRREPACTIWPAGITRKDRLDRVCEVIGTEGRFLDPSLPMRDAEERGLAVDAFIVITAKDRIVADALERYRRSSGIAAKLVVIAMDSEVCNATDPDDAWQLGIAGFDATVPQVVAEFLRAGRLPFSE
jgi:60 kDa SS-A/Ro ribonucleoprotein